MSKSLLITITIFVLIVACAAVLPRPLESDVARGKTVYPDLTLEQLTKGRQVYITRCGSCHPLYSQGQLPRHVWEKQLYPMSKKYSKLDTVQSMYLTRYIHVMVVPTVQKQEGSTGKQRF